MAREAKLGVWADPVYGLRRAALTIRKRDERQFAAAGIELKTLEGRVVRVRGWIEERGGPRIEALHPEQIELAQ